MTQGRTIAGEIPHDRNQGEATSPGSSLNGEGSTRSLLVWVLPALAAGAVLRILFIHFLGQVYGDSIIYGDIASNWLLHGVYGYTTVTGTTHVAPTLIRLPGYPAFLAVVFALFGTQNFQAAMWIQSAIDLAACLLIAAFVGRAVSHRAGRIALWLAALCPFTANYTALPLTETLSIFCVALSLYSFLRVLECLQPMAESRRPSIHRTSASAAPASDASMPGGRLDRASRPRVAQWLWLLVLAASWSYAALLRPEGALLAVVLFVGLIVYGRRRCGWRRSIRLALACGVLSVLPFIPWTLRNWRTFHVFQPLAPRSAEDPGVFTIPGFHRWARTWMVEFTSVYEIGWNVPGESIDFGDLPSRAFDSRAQYEQTRELFDQYNRSYTITPEMDREFARLATERVRAHPFRSRVELPLLRLADMWLRPRLATMDFHLRWWQYSRHQRQTVLAAAYGALNLIYLALALFGALAWRRLRAPMLAAMIAWVLIRSIPLLGVGPEPRYTLEFFPVILAFAAVGLDRIVAAWLPRKSPVPPARFPAPALD